MPFDFDHIHIDFYLRAKSGGEQMGKIILKNKVKMGHCFFRVTDDVVIMNIHVEEKYRGDGLGSMMIEMVKGFAKICDMSIIVSIVEESVDFWERLGFKKLDTLLYEWKSE